MRSIRVLVAQSNGFNNSEVRIDYVSGLASRSRQQLLPEVIVVVDDSGHFLDSICVNMLHLERVDVERDFAVFSFPVQPCSYALFDHVT